MRYGTRKVVEIDYRQPASQTDRQIGTATGTSIEDLPMVNANANCCNILIEVTDAQINKAIKRWRRDPGARQSALACF